MPPKPAQTPNSPHSNETPIRTVSFVSLGCPKNLVDSEKMLGLLAEDGLSVVSREVEEGGADAIVINTCGFLEASKEESLQVIHDAIKAKSQGKLRRVIVAGCLVQRHRAKMLEWAPGIDAMVGVFDRDHIVEAVRGTRSERSRLDEVSDKPKYWIAGNALVAAKERGRNTTGLTVNGKDGHGVGYFEDDSARLRLTPRHYAYLRMSEGCNQNCAFCTIPSIRGKMRSKPLDRIALETRELIADGAFEVNLIGQDTTSYGDDIGLGLTGFTGPKKDRAYRGMPGVLRTVSDVMRDQAIDGWVRLMYAYPTNFSDEMIDAIAELTHPSCSGKGKGKGRVVPYIDIPLQHASDRMLAAMKRNVTAAAEPHAHAAGAHPRPGDPHHFHLRLPRRDRARPPATARVHRGGRLRRPRRLRVLPGRRHRRRDDGERPGPRRAGRGQGPPQGRGDGAPAAPRLRADRLPRRAVR
jgi:ribosomal protein S12 methylthiotransferase